MSHSSFRRIVSCLLVPIAALLLSAGLSLVAASPSQALPRLPQCANNIDDDRDGEVDYPFDSQCRTATDVQEAGPAVRACFDGLDNDVPADGKVDFPVDPGCSSANDQTEADPAAAPACANGVDDDVDGKTDYQANPALRDPGCSWAAENSEVDTACSDTLDNDGDGKPDFPLDFGCGNVNDTSEVDPPQCNDGRDNDGDGTLDFAAVSGQTADPGCSSAADNDETDQVTPPPPPPPGRKAQCADGIDNDNDGRIDYPADGGCSSVADDDEADPAVRFVRCADGIDNDSDGKVDYPADPGCVSRGDDDETDPGPVGPSGSPRVLSPFPIVRLRGRSDRTGVRITLLTVRAPARSTVTVYCTGRSCPRKKVSVRAGTKTVRVRRFERRLRAGTVLKIYVTRPGFVGKYTRFKFVRTRAPLRSDSCATAAGARPRACPSS